MSINRGGIIHLFEGGGGCHAQSISIVRNRDYEEIIYSYRGEFSCTWENSKWNAKLTLFINEFDGDEYLSVVFEDRYNPSEYGEALLFKRCR